MDDKCKDCIYYNKIEGKLVEGTCLYHMPCYKHEAYEARKEVDNVNHPVHYNVNGFEAIDIIQAFTDGLNGIEATDTGNIIKYALRWKRKNGVEDLKKIVWYATHLINYLEGKDER